LSQSGGKENDMAIGVHCIILDTGVRGLVVGTLSRLGETDRYEVRFLDGGKKCEQWFAAGDLEFL
jgi:hypothetical protein